MKIFLLAFLFLISLNVQSQDLDTLPWAPKGATWLYVGAFYDGLFYGKFTYAYDTIVLGRIAKKIAYSQFEIYYQGQYTSRTKEYFVKDYFFYESHDSIFWFNKTQFDLLYIFNPKVTSTWKIPKNNFVTYSVNQSKCIDSFNIDSNTIQVRDITELTYGSKMYGVISTTNSSFWSIGSSIINNIGPMDRPLFPTKGQKCSSMSEFFGVPENLSCYYDSKRGYINFRNYNNDCQGLITSNNDLNIKSLNSLIISPDPVQNTLNIENNFGNTIKSIKIFDFIGREFISIENYSNTDINVAHLPNGMYVLKVLTVDNNFVSSKFVKTE